MNNKKLGIQDVRIIYTRSYKVMDNKVDYLEESEKILIDNNLLKLVFDSKIVIESGGFQNPSNIPDFLLFISADL